MQSAETHLSHYLANKAQMFLIENQLQVIRAFDYLRLWLLAPVVSPKSKATPTTPALDMVEGSKR